MNTALRNILVVIAVPIISGLGWIYVLKFVLWLEEKKMKKKEEKFKCSNCEVEKVEHKGEWCDNCNLPERSVIK